MGSRVHAPKRMRNALAKGLGEIGQDSSLATAAVPIER
jgi:hypothetical protein